MPLPPTVGCVVQFIYYDKLTCMVLIPLIAIALIRFVLWMGFGHYNRLLATHPARCERCGQIPINGGKVAYDELVSQMQKESWNSMSTTGLHRPPNLSFLDIYSSTCHFDCTSAFDPGVNLAITLSANRVAWRARALLRLEASVFISRCWKVVFWLLVILYPGVSVVILKFFHCVEVGDTYYLSSSLLLSCYSPLWRAYLPVALLGIATYVLGVPLLFFSMLWRARNADVRHHWHVIHQHPASLKRWLAMALVDQHTRLLEELKPKEVKRIVVNYLRLRNLKHSRIQTRLGFLYESYAPERYYY